jgi:FkbM family methyltransferase
MDVPKVGYALAVGSYALIKRTGFLDTSLGAGIFTSAYFLYKRYVEDGLAELLHAHPRLCRGGNVLDVGANIGYTASILVGAIDSPWKVFAFEPEPFNFRLLQRLAARADYAGNLLPIQCGVGAENSTADLWLNKGHHADHRVITDRFRASNPGVSGTRISLVSIDAFREQNPGPVSFIKIDVQGYELPVCKGMQHTLDDNANVTILLEYMPSAMMALGYDPATMIRLLEHHGFKPYTVAPGAKLRAGVPASIGASGYADLLFSREPLTLNEI